jgi:hypothetical protein
MWKTTEIYEDSIKTSPLEAGCQVDWSHPDLTLRILLGTVPTAKLHIQKPLTFCPQQALIFMPLLSFPQSGEIIFLYNINLLIL